jgi:thiamine-phosphate pyrophosphorylase
VNSDLSDCRLYGILDLGYVETSDALRVAAALIDGGVDLLQLRGKRQTVAELTSLAASLHKITSGASVPLIINDHVAIAKQVPLEGVHVGQDDQSIAAVREAVGRKILVGKSTHSLAQATAAQAEGADYIGFGPVFATPTKPDYQPIGLTDIQTAHSEITLPIFCIGGIKLDNLEQVIAAGARRVVIVSGLLKAPHIAKYAIACKKMLTSDL